MSCLVFTCCCAELGETYLELCMCLVCAGCRGFTLHLLHFLQSSNTRFDLLQKELLISGFRLDEHFYYNLTTGLEFNTKHGHSAGLIDQNTYTSTIVYRQGIVCLTVPYEHSLLKYHTPHHGAKINTTPRHNLRPILERNHHLHTLQTTILTNTRFSP